MQKYSGCFTTLVTTYLPLPLPFHVSPVPARHVLRDIILDGDFVNHLGTVLPVVKLASVSAVTSL